MSAEEFWKDDPQLFVSYRTSFINKKKREMQEMDYKCWLQGLYTHDGNSKLFKGLRIYLNNVLAGIFKGSKDNSTVESYPEMPYTELANQKKIEEEQKKIKQNNKYKEFENSLVYYGTLKQQYINKLKAKGE